MQRAGFLMTRLNFNLIMFCLFNLINLIKYSYREFVVFSVRMLPVTMLYNLFSRCPSFRPSVHTREYIHMYFIMVVMLTRYIKFGALYYLHRIRNANVIYFVK